MTLDAKSRITEERDFFRSAGAMGMAAGAWLFHDFLLRNGRSFLSQPLPARYRMRVPKACFWNSARLAKISKRLRYAEGYVISPDVPLLIHHAWCVDPADRVVDVTLQDYKSGESRSGNAGYFGIVFEKEFLPRGGQSLLVSDWGYQIDFWLKLDPGFATVLKEAEAAREMLSSAAK